MGQWRRFTVITWSDSNCNARALAQTPNAEYALSVVGESAASERHRMASSGSPARCMLRALTICDELEWRACPPGHWENWNHPCVFGGDGRLA